MREIEFRGWDKELKKWHYGNYYFYTDTVYCVASDKDNEENEHHCILFDGFAIGTCQDLIIKHLLTKTQ